jgi:flagellar biosynthesis protein FlhB
MAEEDDSQKTEDPTEKRIQKSRQRGSVASSQEVKSWFILMGGAVAMAVAAPGIMSDIRQIGATFIEQSDSIPTDIDHLPVVLGDLFLEIGFILGPLMLILVVLSLMSNILQTGLLWAPEKPKPELSKISLFKGFKRMFSMRAIVEFLKGIAKLVAVSVVAFGLALPFLDDISLIPSIELSVTLKRIHEIAIVLIMGTVGVMTAIAIADFAYQKYTNAKQMKMSKQEVKDEHKQSEGDPQVKARIRRLRMERAQQRMMASVPEADVVITNPTHYAVALQYKMEDMTAPKLLAKGVDHVAMRIRETAEENDIPLVENPPLARALYASVELDEEIPAEHYQVVAEIIGYVMRMRGDLPKSTKGAKGMD